MPLVTLLNSPAKTADVVDDLKRLLGTPLRAKLPALTPLVQQPTVAGCKCQFLFQEIFGLPAELRPNVRTMVKGAVPTYAGPTDKGAYVGLTVVHACPELGAPEQMSAHVRWGFAVEPSVNYRFLSGPINVFKAIQRGMGAAFGEPIWRPVPSMPTFGLAFVGRMVELQELQTKGYTPADIVDMAAADLEKVYALLSRAT